MDIQSGMSVNQKIELLRKKAQEMGWSEDQVALGTLMIQKAEEKKQLTAQEAEQGQLTDQMKLQQQAMNLQITQKKLEEQLNPTPTLTPEQKGAEAATVEITKQKKLESAGLGKKAETADEKKNKKKLEDVLSSINLLEKNYREAEIKGPGSGDFATLISNVSRGAMYPNVKTYEDLRKSLIGPLARTISGEVGVLTDKDISRAEGLLPKINEDSRVVEKKLQNLRQTLAEKSGQKITKKNKSKTKSRFTIIEVK